MHDVERLEVWQRAMALVVVIYEATRVMPVTEQFGLKAQMRRAAVSIPSNLAEGAGRSSSKDVAHFVAIALGSASELRCQLMICERLGLMSPEAIGPAVDESRTVMRKLERLRQSLVEDPR